MKQSIINALLVVASFNTSIASAMDAAPVFQQAKVPFTIGNKQVEKLWIAPTSIEYTELMKDFTKYRAYLSNPARKELVRFLEDEKSILLLDTVRYSYSQPTNPKPDSVSSQIGSLRASQKVTVLKSLCEHGGICETCVNKDGWSFVKQFLVRNNMVSEVYDSGPTEIRCFKEGEKERIVSVSKLCKIYKKKMQEADDAELALLATRYVTVPEALIPLLEKANTQNNTDTTVSLVASKFDHIQNIN